MHCQAASLNTCETEDPVMSLKVPQKVELFDSMNKENSGDGPESPLLPVA